MKEQSPTSEVHQIENEVYENDSLLRMYIEREGQQLSIAVESPSISEVSLIKPEATNEPELEIVVEMPSDKSDEVSFTRR